MNNKLMMGMALAAVVCSCAGKGGENVQQTVAEKAPVVSVVTATRQTVPQEEVYSSTVQANVVNNIAPQSGNRIVKLNVEVGDFVSAGQVLAEMDRVQLDQAALKLKNDEVELRLNSRSTSPSPATRTCWTTRFSVLRRAGWYLPATMTAGTCTPCPLLFM